MQASNIDAPINLHENCLVYVSFAHWVSHDYRMQNSSQCVPEEFSPVLEVKRDRTGGLAPHAVLIQLSPQGILPHLALLLCSFLARCLPCRIALHVCEYHILQSNMIRHVIYI